MIFHAAEYIYYAATDISRALSSHTSSSFLAAMRVAEQLIRCASFDHRSFPPYAAHAAHAARHALPLPHFEERCTMLLIPRHARLHGAHFSRHAIEFIAKSHYRQGPHQPPRLIIIISWAAWARAADIDDISPKDSIDCAIARQPLGCLRE